MRHHTPCITLQSPDSKSTTVVIVGTKPNNLTVFDETMISLDYMAVFEQLPVLYAIPREDQVSFKSFKEQLFTEWTDLGSQRDLGTYNCQYTTQVLVPKAANVRERKSWKAITAPGFKQYGFWLCALGSFYWNQDDFPIWVQYCSGGMSLWYFQKRLRRVWCSTDDSHVPQQVKSSPK